MEGVNYPTIRTTKAERKILKVCHELGGGWLLAENEMATAESLKAKGLVLIEPLGGEEVFRAILTDEGKHKAAKVRD